MPNYVIEYRLRIRDASTVANPNGTTDALIISSVPGGTNPYIASPPTGDGQELDVVTGAVRTGAFTVEIVDVATGTDGTGTVRVFTNSLEDVSYRQQLLSRRAFIESRLDGGAWIALQAGYITSIRLTGAMRYVVTVADTRRVEMTQPIATRGTLGSYATRGCIIGGPVTQDFGPIRARGGWEYEVTGVSGRVVDVVFRSGYAPNIGSPVVTDFKKLYREEITTLINSLGSMLSLQPIGQYGGGRVVTDLTLYVGTTPTNAVASTIQLAAPGWFGDNLDSYGLATMTLLWPTSASPSLPSPGDRLWISMAQTTVSAASPLLIDAHPVDIVRAVWDDIGLVYNPSASWVTSVRDLIGPDVRVAVRLTESPTAEQFLLNTVYGPFGLTTRTIGENQQLVATRICTDAVPAITIAASDLMDDAPVVFDIDEKSAVQSVTVTMQVLAQYNAAPDTTGSPVPPDGLAVTTVTQRMTNALSTVFGGRDISYDIPGMVHNAGSFVPAITDFVRAVGQQILSRFGYGAATAEVAVVTGATTATAAMVGSEVYLEAPHYPNRNYRIGESSVGARIMQVVQRTVVPTGVRYRLMDSGINAQPVSPAPTLSVTASTDLPNSVALFQITNAATINSGGVLSVEMEWAVGTSTPTANGETFTIYPPGEVPTGAVALPAVSGSGQTIYVRARTLQSGRRASAWTAWSSVALTAYPQPGSASATMTDTSAQVQWTNTTVRFPIAVHLFAGGSAPANWAPYRVATVPATTTIATLRSLTASLTYQIGLAYDTGVGLGPMTVLSVTASGSTSAATRPAGLALLTQTDDATLPQGIALGLYASNPTLDMIIERSVTSGSGFTQLARVTGGSTTYADLLPRNATTYYYRVRHALGGFTTSSATGEVSGQARGIPQPLVRPGAVVPTVGLAITETSTTGTLTLVITDPQQRLTQVRFRDDGGTGTFGAWTVDGTAPYTYTVTIPLTGFIRVEYEVSAFDADGVDRVIATGIESFDRGAAANIVAATGLFSTVGVFTVSVQADTDTASIKYALSATPWANDAAAYAAAQAGALINARSGTFTNTGPWAVGDVVYVAFAAYDGAGGTGNVTGPYRYAFTNGARDTISLTARARVTATTATTQTVRVAVACPVAPSPNTATIRYSVTGLSGVTPADSSGNTVTPELADSVSATESVGTYIDFTVPRPAVGDPPGRITFTVTAASRVSATDAVDVVAQNIVGPSLSIVTTPSTSSYSLVVTFDGTIAYDLDGVSQSVSGWTSPQTVTITRNDFSGAAKVAAFRATKDGSTIGESVTVPAKDATSASITIGTQNADDVTNQYEFSWTGSGFPSGTQYDLQYRTVTTAGVVEEGYLTNQTSPVTVTSGYTIGTTPTYQMTVFARSSDTVLMSRFRAGTFLT